MRVIHAVFFSLLMVGCVCLDPRHKRDVAPIVSTSRVIESLADSKRQLAEAGKANSTVSEKIDTALSLASELDVVLQQIEARSALSTNSDKVVLKPVSVQ